jgi:putative SOS response-associated peptidase YedK
VVNFCSEGRRFDKGNRCCVPAPAFFEFTGKAFGDGAAAFIYAVVR